LELKKVQDAAAAALRLGLKVNAGHGLDYENVGPIARVPGLHELNIGFSIVGRALFVGLESAVREMKALL
jgi:pyridoxine 5-phosphate synthase